MRITPPRTSPRGFTLVEMLTVITIIGMLAAISMPAVPTRLAKRLSGSACQNNLRQFGIGLTLVAGRRGTVCTGTFDWRRDGGINGSRLGRRSGQWRHRCRQNALPVEPQ